MIHTDAAETTSALRHVLADFHRLAAYDHHESLAQLSALVQGNAAESGTPDDQRLAAAFGAPASWPSTSGSGLLNTLAILAVCQPGDTIIVQRDAPASVIAPLVQLGLQPVYVVPPFVAEHGLYGGLSPAALARTLAMHPQTRAVLLTYPTCFGVATAITACASLVQDHAIPLIIDATYGAHFAFHMGFPTAASAVGADIVTHALHPMCGVLGQGALALLDGEETIAAFRRALTSLGGLSTSRSDVLLQSLVLGVHQLVHHGNALLEQALARSTRLREALAAIDGIRILDAADIAGENEREGGVQLDPLQLTIDVSGLGLTGIAVRKRLVRAVGIEVDLATLTQVLIRLPLTDEGVTDQALLVALRRLADDAARRPYRPLPPLPVPQRLPRQLLLPRQAFYTRRRYLPLRDAVGLPAAETVSVCPSRSPLVVVGEEITAEIIEILRMARAQGMPLSGLADPSGETLAVVDRRGLTTAMRGRGHAL